MEESRLSQHQVEFITRFLDPDAPAFWHLIAPPGSGKTITAVSLVGEMFESHGPQRVLVLVDAALGLQYESMLHDELQSAPIIRADRQFFRELEARATPGTNPWPRPIVAVVSLDLAKREEIAQSLSAAKWDLVLVDQSHSLMGQRAALLGQLLGANAIGRLLLLGVTDKVPLKASIPGIATWNWRHLTWDLTDAALPSTPIIFHVVEYERSPSEVDFLHRLRSLAKQLGKGSARDLRASLLVRVASSSLFAADQTIHRLRNRLAHESFLSSEKTDQVNGTASPDADQLEELTDDEPGLAIELARSRTNLKIVTDMLNALDEVTDDRKLQSLASLLEGIIDTGARRTIVFAAYASTISYLQTSLEEMVREAVHALTGSTRYDERHAILDHFRRQGGVLVCPPSIMTGTDLNLNLDAAIVYDLPRSPMATAQLLARLSRPSNRASIAVYLLNDVSGAIPEEKHLFQMLDKIEELNKPMLEELNPSGV